MVEEFVRLPTASVVNNQVIGREYGSPGDRGLFREWAWVVPMLIL